MHYHLEIIMPPQSEIETAVEIVLHDFDENNDEARHAFWDWWQLGGRYSGSKIEAAVSKEQRDAFYAELLKRGVTVSGLHWGKQELQPASQIDAVDALWREMCPNGGNVCPIFKHSGDSMNGDICLLRDLPSNLTAYRLIVAALDHEGKELTPASMFAQSNWNGVTHEDTKWDGNVSNGLSMHLERVKNYAEAYAARVTPQPDWIAVTVDYHS